MKKYILVAIAVAAIAPLLAIGGARTGTSVDMKCDTMSISADSLLKETPLFDRLYLDAVCRQIAGDSTASALLERCHEMRPDAAEVYYSLAHSYLKQGNDSLARVNMRRAAELQPDNDNYLENVAETYIDQREYDRAIEAYEQLYAHHRDRSDVLELLVRLYNAKKDYPKMLSTIDRMEQADGPSEEISLMRMGIYEQQGDKKNAYRILHALTNDHPNEPSYKVMLGNWLMQHDRQKEAYKLFTDVLKEEPDNAYAESSLYDYYNATQQEAEARKMLDRILLGNTTPVDTKLVMIRSFIQDNERNGADSTQVLALFDKMLQVPKPSSDIAAMRAAYMSLKEMPKDTINQAFEKVLEIAPDNVEARLQLVQNLWDDKKYDKVIEMTDQAQAYNPDEMVFYYFGGMAHYLKGDDDKTLDTFRKGVAQVNEKSSPELVSDLYMIMGDILNKKGLEKESYAAYDSCLQWKDDNIPALNNYAYYISLKGENLHKAEQMSYKTIKAEPKNGTYLDTYAWILFMEERYHEAKIYMDQAIANMDSTETSNVVLEHAGDIYAMNGLTDEAMKYWKKSYDGGNKTDAMELKLKYKKYIPEEKAEKMTDMYSTERYGVKKKTIKRKTRR